MNCCNTKHASYWTSIRICICTCVCVSVFLHVSVSHGLPACAGSRFDKQMFQILFICMRMCEMPPSAPSPSTLPIDSTLYNAHVPIPSFILYVNLYNSPPFVVCRRRLQIVVVCEMCEISSRAHTV